MKLPKLPFVLFLIFLALPVKAVEYGGVGGRPANPQPGNPRTESIFIFTLTPDASQEDGVRVINNSGEKKTLLVYAVDSAVSTGGAFTCAQAVDAKVDAGAWIEMSKQEVTLESMTNEVVPFKIKAPVTASVGEHNACIVIQEKKDAGQANGNGIQLSFRTAMRVAVLVPGQIQRTLAIGDFKMSMKNKDTYFLQPSVKNTGNVSVDANVKVHTEYFFGKPLQDNGGQYPILRGQTSDWNFELAKPFWGGWYKTSYTVEYDADANAVLGKDTDKPKTVLRGKDTTFFVMPAPKAMAIEGGVLVLFIGIVLSVIFNLRSLVKKRR